MTPQQRQRLDVLEAIDGPDQEWLIEAARAFEDEPPETYSDRNHPRHCPGCGRIMPRKIRHHHIHLLLPSLNLACPARGRVRSSSVPGEVTCVPCIIIILRAQLSR
jgi:hypothetical protein